MNTTSSIQIQPFHTGVFYNITLCDDYSTNHVMAMAVYLIQRPIVTIKHVHLVWEIKIWA